MADIEDFYCDRPGCENVHVFGWKTVSLDGRKYLICFSCEDELVEYFYSWRWDLAEHEVNSRIRHFLNTNPGHFSDAKEYVPETYKMFSRITGIPIVEQEEPNA